MLPTTATIRAAKQDRVAGGQQQLPTGKVVPDCYTSKSNLYVYLLFLHATCHTHAITLTNDEGLFMQLHHSQLLIFSLAPTFYNMKLCSQPGYLFGTCLKGLSVL
jgi:hypothetical protein